MKNYKYLNLPASSIISKTIFKKQFYSNADISSSDIALFTNRISKITWLYSLRPDTINVQPYKDEIREYTEIEIIEVEITVDKGIGRIAEIIIKSIPYPILLIFRLDDKTAFYAALQRTNLSDCSKNIIEQTVKTDWLDPDSTLFAMLNFKKFRFMNYFTIYTDLVDTISV